MLRRPLVRRATFLLAALLLWASLARTARAEAFELRVLTYNTHGLQSFLAGDAPERRFPMISPRLNGYDVALIQEDVSCHDALVAQARHPVVLRGNGLRLPGLPLFQSGLTTLVAAPPDRVEGVVREGYGRCNGWLEGKNDCLARKGWLRVRLRLPDGRALDVYQTHLDAGGGARDQRTRELQLEQLARRIDALSGDGAAIVAGDFNLNGWHRRPREVLQAFARRLGLRDSGARARAPARFAPVDYIFYRSGPGLEIELVEAGEAREFVVDGEPLSDHPALFTRLRLR
ncbi:MAG: endonuclease/exonuclease/phosphatase family protein [Proteobacteria bacterium]|nr:endonuclease/exonuclease/phosphatase family protein [Pseudomonadota bacterium]